MRLLTEGESSVRVRPHITHLGVWQLHRSSGWQLTKRVRLSVRWVPPKRVSRLDAAAKLPTGPYYGAM